jgi:hypothetical protein
MNPAIFVIMCESMEVIAAELLFLDQQAVQFVPRVHGIQRIIHFPGS